MLGGGCEDGYLLKGLRDLVRESLHILCVFFSEGGTLQSSRLPLFHATPVQRATTFYLGILQVLCSHYRKNSHPGRLLCSYSGPSGWTTFSTCIHCYACVLRACFSERGRSSPSLQLALSGTWSLKNCTTISCILGLSAYQDTCDISHRSSSPAQFPSTEHLGWRP